MHNNQQLPWKVRTCTYLSMVRIERSLVRNVQKQNSIPSYPFSLQIIFVEREERETTHKIGWNTAKITIQIQNHWKRNGDDFISFVHPLYSRLCLNPYLSVDTQNHGFSWSMGSKRGGLNGPQNVLKLELLIKTF